jgi:hypothetical protein
MAEHPFQYPEMAYDYSSETLESVITQWNIEYMNHQIPVSAQQARVQSVHALVMKCPHKSSRRTQNQRRKHLWWALVAAGADVKHVH